MANEIVDEYLERGAIYVTVVIDDSPDAGTTVDWTDAQYWAYSMDFDSDTKIDKVRNIVLADVDGALWNRYVDSCSDLSGINQLLCQASCQVTPQVQILDQGGLTVWDPCSRGAGQNQCGGCGWDENGVRSILNQILPAKVCGEAVATTP